MVHFLSATAAAHLLELAELYELVWASGWEERADEHLPRLLGVPARAAVLRFERAAGNSGAHWKLEAIDGFAGERALAWVDDCFNDACRRWAAARASPTLLVATEPRRGLTSRETAVLREWASPRLGRRGGAAPRQLRASPPLSSLTGAGGERLGHPRRERFRDRGPVGARSRRTGPAAAAGGRGGGASASPHWPSASVITCATGVSRRLLRVADRT